VLNGPDIVAAFSPTYAEARAKFLAAAQARGLAVESHVHPSARGAAGEELACDIAILGRGDAPSLVYLVSGTHGAEGFCGAGIQVALLNDPEFVAAVERGDVAVLFHHALNPYGFSYLRRTNEDNIDLNRNFRDFSMPPPRNDAYAEIHDFMVPAIWPPTAENEARMGAYIAARGMAALQQAVTSGQCDRADGLFYGGIRPAWSNGVVRDILRRHAAGRQRLAWIDIHTALGPRGYAEKIFAGPNDAAMRARAAAIWGADITSFHDGSSTSAKLTGVNFSAVLDECPDVSSTGIALEYGTLPLAMTLNALRADQWLKLHPDAPAATRAAIKQQVRDAFYCDTDDWKGMVYGQARTAMVQALKGLAAAAR
jgi:hypothetical protein